jgi:hypothetical protein
MSYVLATAISVNWKNLSVCCLLDMGVDPSTVSPKQAGQAVITLGEGRDKLEQRLLSYLQFCKQNFVIYDFRKYFAEYN